MKNHVSAFFIASTVFISTSVTVCMAEQTDQGLFMEMISDSLLGRNFEKMGFSLRGWVQVSYTLSSSKNNQLPLGFNYLSNEPQLQQSWVHFEREADDALPLSLVTDWILPGTDYRFTLANGILMTS
jgi:hypothetical protein